MTFGLLALTMPLTLGAPMSGPYEQPPAPAPFLHVKFLAPQGTKTTLYPATPDAVTFIEPTSFGLRPGYIYRMELSDIPEMKGVKLYPTLEVRGTLQPPKMMDVSKYPVPLVLTDDDLAFVMKGRLLTKYIVLESPEKAEAVQTKPDQLLESRFPTEEEAYKEAREKGRLVLIVRLGEKELGAEELARSNIPGTILLPGMKSPPIPAFPPYMPFGGAMLYDPRYGPKVTGEECLADGGDTQKVIGIGKFDRVNGLDPSDTAIEFTTSKGKKVVPSNRVCLCIPRFIALRAETQPMINNLTLNPLARHQLEGPDRLKNKLKPYDAFRVDAMKGVQARTRPNGINGSLGVFALDGFSGKPMGLATIAGTKIVASVQELEEINSTDCKMLLVKWIDPPYPEKIGDEVTFFLKYHNATNSTMSDVVISDNLTTRLVYVPNTAKSDRGATFTVEPNEVGSAILRWAVDGKLKAGEGGIITFKAKIR